MLRYLIKENRSKLRPEEASREALRLLASLLRDVLHVDGLPKIDTTPSGKPWFPELPDVHFSISHCDSAVMVALSSSPVGCDIEDVQSDCPAELLELTCTPAERQAIESSPDPPLEFTKIWTRKEAGIKRLGHIPDNPVDWLSDSPGITILTSVATRYVFSIAGKFSDQDIASQK